MPVSRSIVHHHPQGPEHVLALYGEDGLEFHLTIAHEVTDSGEMDAHEQEVYHVSLHEVGALEESGNEDEWVDPDLLADAIGPVPIERFRLRDDCVRCTLLAEAPVGDWNAEQIRQHVLAAHAHQVVLPSGHDDTQ